MSASWCRLKKCHLLYGFHVFRIEKCKYFALRNILQRRNIICSANVKCSEPVGYHSTVPGEKKNTDDFPSKYTPKYTEAAWYDWWVEQGFFSPQVTWPDKTSISRLQEHCTKTGILPQYDLIANQGAVHDPTFTTRFTMRVTVGEVTATGQGSTKKKAKHAAAQAYLDQIPDISHGQPGPSGQPGHKRVDSCDSSSTGNPGERFVICLPPPNVTGTLHLGHALTCAIQDAIVRRQRMLGRDTLWIPGTDHGGIATQVVVEKQLWSNKQTRHDIGVEDFLTKMDEWKNSKTDGINDQMKKLGCSLDWDRSTFTLDKKMNVAVTEAFIRLHKEGLIYRSNKMINWSCQLKSTVSDMEVEKVTIVGPTMLKVPGYEKPVRFGEMISFDYPVVDSDERITVSTTRLETMLGDTAVAVHPDDARYTHLHGRYLRHPLDGRHIPVICDTYVDKDFGTGAVKITPAHDPNDYEIGVRHNLPSINVINDEGKMENVIPECDGLLRFHARQKVLDMLKDKKLLKGIDAHSMVLPVCSRSKDIIEPRLKAQWFLNCDDMARNAVQVVKSGELTFEPDFYKKIWFDFLEESQDWCISRQIWWGHRIPAYRVVFNTATKPNKDEVWVSGHNEEDAYTKAEEKLGINRSKFILKQDDDVLDTWFSSALYPFSVLGWPEQTEDLAKYYPSSLLETGSDIIFFWVARMIMMGHKMTGQLPFKKVLFHGTLRDAHGRKMSKSLGNVIDPMDVIHGISLQDLHDKLNAGNLDKKEIALAKKGQKKDFPRGIPECGTDALRFALCSYNFKDPEISMNIEHVENYRRFCNKIWQGYRYWRIVGADYTVDDKMLGEVSDPVDLWMLSRLSNMVDQCNTKFDTYDLHNVTSILYNFWMNDFCGVYIGHTRQMFDACKTTSPTTQTHAVLYTCISTFMRALSPFMPYLSEELYQRMTSHHVDSTPPSVCVAPYPQTDMYPWYNKCIEDDVSLVRDICTGIMALKQTSASSKSQKRQKVAVFIKTSPEQLEDLQNSIQPFKDLITLLSDALDVTVVTSDIDLPKRVLLKLIRPEISLYIQPLMDDLNKEMDNN